MHVILSPIFRLVCLMLVFTASAQGEADPLQGHRFQQIHMGMPVHLVVYAPTTQQAQTAGKAAYQRVKQLDGVLSDWKPDSELNRLCAKAGGGPVPVSDDLFAVLLKAKRLAEATQGAFDPTASPVVRLWRQARQSGQAPPQPAMQKALSRTGHQHLILNPADQTAELSIPGIKLDLGGIAKGYIGDQVANTLRAHGVDTFLYIAGGDIIAGNAPPPPEDSLEDLEQPQITLEKNGSTTPAMNATQEHPSGGGGRGWQIDPTHYADASGEQGVESVPVLYLQNEAASISGDTVQFVVIDGTRYSHVVDPRTGQGITSRRMCVVRGQHGIDTDGLATAGTIMEPGGYTKLVKAYGAEAWVFTASE